MVSCRHSLSIGQNMDVNDFQEWLASAAVGAQCLYHTGELARDAQGTDTVPSVPGLKQLAKAAMKAELWGDFALFQRRLKRNRFQYIAMRTQSQQYRSRSEEHTSELQS